MALYGCEASLVANKQSAQLFVAIAKAIGPYSHGSSNLLAAHLAAPGQTFVPAPYVLNRSLGLMRRIFARHERARALASNILALHLKADKKGTIDEEE